ncbi:MAG TPA: type II toxin-antitoxin system VapC family toxin [Candidatus Acidoferrum sp.]|nr:type II toxin-antitoxin system VapC family toxin [Candidatus Acidoferrum sp.]
MLDTSVLIDVLRRRRQRREALEGLVIAQHSLFTTALNVAELYAGMRPGEERQTEALLAGLECLDVAGSAARLAGALKNRWARRGRTLALVDALIAATAIEQNCALLTDNHKHFPMPEVRMYPLP